MNVELKITSLGAQGDGVAENSAGHSVYIPFALPDENVIVSLEGKRARLLEVKSQSALRIEPVCRYFGDCGGCAIQHLDFDSYLEWKREKVVRALEFSNILEPVDPVVHFSGTETGKRRRLTFTAANVNGRLLFGFNAFNSHRIVDIQECPIAVAIINESLSALRGLARLFLKGSKPLRITVTATKGGLDIALDDIGKIQESLRQRALSYTLENRFLRLTVGNDVIVQREKPTVYFGDVRVHFPPGSFLQASEDAEQAMATLVCDFLQGAKHNADLFSGCGTFALRLGKAARVHSVESDSSALNALDEAARQGTGLKPHTVERRDLFRRPLTSKELNQFDGVVFDPPRAGAEAQSEQIAKSSVKRVAAVSCNPTSLARDLRILVDGGYVIKRIIPIDQFLWTPHVEVVALLEKVKKRN